MKLGHVLILLSMTIALCLFGICPTPAMATSISPIQQIMDCAGVCESTSPAAAQGIVADGVEFRPAGMNGGQFSKQVATSAAGYSLPYCATACGVSLDGAMSTTNAHLSLRAIPVAVEGPLPDMAFMETYSPAAGGLTDGQGLIAVVPEPITMFTLLMGGGSLAGYIRRRFRK